jgi:hypothetical protein
MIVSGGENVIRRRSKTRVTSLGPTMMPDLPGRPPYMPYKRFIMAVLALAQGTEPLAERLGKAYGSNLAQLAPNEMSGPAWSRLEAIGARLTAFWRAARLVPSNLSSAWLTR